MSDSTTATIEGTGTKPPDVVVRGNASGFVRAHQKVAVGKHKRFTPPLAHSCERLRRVRDERRNARPDRCRYRIERWVDTGTARETDGDRGQLPGASHPKIGDKHPPANRSHRVIE